MKCCNFSLINNESINSLESQECRLPVESFFLVRKRWIKEYRWKHAAREEKTITHILNPGHPDELLGQAYSCLELLRSVTLRLCKRTKPAHTDTERPHSS